MPHKNIFVFDIETVPDTSVVKYLTHSEGTNEVELRKELEDYSAEVSGGNPFPRQPFHRVVAISFLEATIEQLSDGTERYKLTGVRSGGSEKSTEEEIIRGVFNYLSKSSFRLVSYNGRTFDMPVLKYRAMKYGVTAAWLFRSGDKWNNYQQRYSLDWHCDLLEAFSDFGASARCKMNEICAIMGIPGKIGIDGSQVACMFDEGKIKDIRDYCETDVINTYLLYLNFQLHSGNISHESFMMCNQNLKNYMQNFCGTKKHFAEFLDEWKQCDTRKVFE